MKAIGLVRVSSLAQIDGVSLDAQSAKIASYCSMMDLELVEVIVEAGKSGTTADREGLQEAMRRLEAGEVQALVVYSLSRLSRRVVDTLQLLERIDRCGASFHSINEKIETTSAFGRFFVTLISALNALERDQLADRTSMALRHLQAEGHHVGRPPFGYIVGPDGKLVPKQEQAALIDRIIAARANGLSLQRIADQLNSESIPSQTGRLWHAKTVQSVIKRAS